MGKANPAATSSHREMHSVILACARHAECHSVGRLDTARPFAGAFASPTAQAVVEQFSRTLTMKNAVVLLSGGMDSATVLAIARAQGFVCYALSVDYGPRHYAELAAAQHVARTTR